MVWRLASSFWGLELKWWELFFLRGRLEWNKERGEALVEKRIYPSF